LILSALVMAVQAAPIQVEPGHTRRVGLVAPRVIGDGHGERLMVPTGWQADMRSALSAAGHGVVSGTDAQVLLRPVVRASGCTTRRQEVRCTAWIEWQLAAQGYSPPFVTEVEGRGAALEDASRATWAAAVQELLGDLAFVRELHHGPLSRYDCALAGQLAAVPVRVSPPRESSWDATPPQATWSWGMVLGTQEGYLLTGLVFFAGGGAVMGLSVAAGEAVDQPTVDVVLQGAALFGAAHFVVGASMLGIKLTEGERARVVFTGTGLGVSGRF